MMNKGLAAFVGICLTFLVAAIVLSGADRVSDTQDKAITGLDNKVTELLQ